ncbi:MAG: LON peptidase substrate-binding domain-containing protein [Acidimicrobiia bacterium]
MPASPMFPLGNVLFPHGILPLHVFEPRYRSMMEECLADEGTFGVVLIERGSEVGGGDVRFDVGTLARIVQAGRFDDGRYAVVTVGVQRVRVDEWLPDDPYPRAVVEVLDDATVGDAPAHLEEVTRLLERVRALHVELGAPVGTDPVTLAVDDPVRASFEAAAMAPIGPLDAQALLEVDDAGERLERLVELLTDEARALEFRLADDS